MPRSLLHSECEKLRPQSSGSTGRGRKVMPQRPVERTSNVK